MNYFGGGGALPPSGGGGSGNGKHPPPPGIKPDPPDPCKLTPGEENCLKSVLSEEDAHHVEEQIEAAHRKLWLHFQSAAASLTQLYRNGEQLRQRRGGEGASSHLSSSTRDDQLWVPFQTAASNLTTLYRESWEGLLRPAVQASRKAGYTRARKELASWARSRRRVIRREELLAALASMSCPESARTTTTTTASAAAAAASGGLGREPLLGVEELLQAATVGDEGSLFAARPPLKRSATSTVVSSRTPSPKTPPIEDDDIMSDLFGPPVIKKPRQS